MKKIITILIVSFWIGGCDQAAEGGPETLNPDDTAAKHKPRKDHTQVEKEFEDVVNDTIHVEEQ